MKVINPFKKSYSNRELVLFRFLKSISIFEQLNFEQMAHFVPTMHLRVYKENEVVFFRGDPSQALYLLHKGEIALSIDIKDRFETIGHLSSGKSFGDNSLVHDSSRIYNAIVTSEKAQVYVIPQINLFEIFDHYPKIKAKMMESYVNQQNQFMSKLFSAYKTNFGFFDLGDAYGKM